MRIGMSNTDIFFRNPSEPPQLPGEFGILYLLRRDVRTCFDNEAVWPGVMAILAGVDLLGKFHAGNDQSGGVGDRFRSFVHDYFTGLTVDDEETVFQLRNAVLHSFGWYSEGRGGRVYRFLLARQGTQLIRAVGGDVYVMDVVTLCDQFETAVGAYETDVRQNQDSRTRFDAMFVKYGSMGIG
jgi:hypothetical protein